MIILDSELLEPGDRIVIQVSDSAVEIHTVKENLFDVLVITEESYPMDITIDDQVPVLNNID